jgi:hypothetical protein
MALLTPLAQDNVRDKDGNAFVITKVRHDGGASNTFLVPPGAVSVATLVAPGETAPTTTVAASATPGTATVTLANGSAVDLYVVTRHVGRNPAGL